MVGKYTISPMDPMGPPLGTPALPWPSTSRQNGWRQEERRRWSATLGGLWPQEGPKFVWYGVFPKIRVGSPKSSIKK